MARVVKVPSSLATTYCAKMPTSMVPRRNALVLCGVRAAMNNLGVGALALVMALALGLGACRRADGTGAPGGEFCGVTEDGGLFDVGGRLNIGVRAQADRRLQPPPLAFNAQNAYESLSSQATLEPAPRVALSKSVPSSA
jgi:hypothetical protein